MLRVVEKSLLEGTALKDVIESECFHINRDYETTKADYSRLFDHETQKIKKRKGDEADGKGGHSGATHRWQFK